MQGRRLLEGLDDALEAILLSGVEVLVEACSSSSSHARLGWVLGL